MICGSFALDFAIVIKSSYDYPVVGLYEIWEEFDMVEWDYLNNTGIYLVSSQWLKWCKPQTEQVNLEVCDRNTNLSIYP